MWQRRYISAFMVQGHHSQLTKSIKLLWIKYGGLIKIQKIPIFLYIDILLSVWYGFYEAIFQTVNLCIENAYFMENLFFL